VCAGRGDLTVGGKRRAQLRGIGCGDRPADVALVHVEAVGDGAEANQSDAGDVAGRRAVDGDVLPVAAGSWGGRDFRARTGEQVWRGEQLQPVLEVLVWVSLELSVLASPHHSSVGK